MKLKKRETKLQEEQRKKKELAEEDEELAVLGQESEKKGAKWVKEKFKEEEKEEGRLKNIQREILKKERRKQWREYKLALAKTLAFYFRKIDWPRNYVYNIYLTEQGIVAEFRNEYRKRYVRAVKPCGEIKYDFKAMELLAIFAEETIDRLAGMRKTDSGILLPN